MNYIISDSIGSAWIKSIEFIFNNGHNTVYDDKGYILEVMPLTIEVVNPKPMDKLIQKFGDEKMIDFMLQNFENEKPIKNWGYSYCQRLYNHRGINQIEYIIKKLQKNKYAKSATFSLLDFEHDNKHKPCFVSIDFKIRNDILYTYSFFRSQDIGKKMYADFISLERIGKKICDELNLKTQVTTVFICSAHIYEKDMERCLKILENKNDKNRYSF